MVREKTYENISCSSRNFTSNLLIFLLRWKVSELSTILMIRGCTLLVHPQIIKIVNNSEAVVRRKTNEYKSCLSWCFTSNLLILFLLRWKVSELSTVLMIRGCTSLVHVQIIKIVDNSETVGRRKNLWIQKLLISKLYV